MLEVSLEGHEHQAHVELPGFVDPARVVVAAAKDPAVRGFLAARIGQTGETIPPRWIPVLVAPPSFLR
jgi:hypothetical protein